MATRNHQKKQKDSAVREKFETWLEGDDRSRALALEKAARQASRAAFVRACLLSCNFDTWERLSSFIGGSHQFLNDLEAAIKDDLEAAIKAPPSGTQLQVAHMLDTIISMRSLLESVQWSRPEREKVP